VTAIGPRGLVVLRRCGARHDRVVADVQHAVIRNRLDRLVGELLFDRVLVHA